MGKKMNKRGLVTIEILSLIFVPGFLSLFVVSKTLKLLKKKTKPL